MLLKREKSELDRIQRQIRALGGGSATPSAPGRDRAYYEALRDALHLYSDVIERCARQREKLRGPGYRRLRSLANRAIRELGGQAEPAFVSLKRYDHRRYGPFLGVSDDGGAAEDIRDAALASPKMCVLGQAEPIVVGVAHDAERLGAVGEVIVGPDEYRTIRLACMGRILTSTNVGTRLNLRYYKRRPVVEIEPGDASEAIQAATKKAAAVIEGFLHTPDRRPRPLTVFARFAGRTRFAWKQQVLEGLAKAFRSGKFCKPDCHKLGLLACCNRGARSVRAARIAIDLASGAGLSDVAVEGSVLREADDKISMPGLLNYFPPEDAAQLLAYAARKNISLTPKNLVDPDTVARSVWAGLRTAHNMGLELGKYGLFPLTLAESAEVMRLVQGWFRSWTAAPALYVDFPIVDQTKVYTERRIVRGIREWLTLVASHHIPVVLIDTADKDRHRKLIKSGPTDEVGILTLREIARLDAHARRLRIKVLWAGGLTIPQAYEMGKLQVFGIYVTTSASVARPVGGGATTDPMLPSEKQPTYSGVLWTKLLLESGFLVTRLRKQGLRAEAALIEKAAHSLSTELANKNLDLKAVKHNRQILAGLAENAWRRFLKH